MFKNAYDWIVSVLKAIKEISATEFAKIALTTGGKFVVAIVSWAIKSERSMPKERPPDEPPKYIVVSSKTGPISIRGIKKNRWQQHAKKLHRMKK